MFEDPRVLKNARSLREIAEALHMTKAELIFHNTRELEKLIPEPNLGLRELVYESIAEIFIFLGGRSEFLENILPLDRQQLKNIQRRLEKQGVLDGVTHAKRLLEGADRAARLCLSKSRIAISILLMHYEQLTRHYRKDRISLFHFILAYVLTKDIFEHPQIYGVKEEMIPIDMAFFFVFELINGRVNWFFCGFCGQVYCVFGFEADEVGGVKCPYCKLLSTNYYPHLKEGLQTGFV